ncbi:MAG: hypothetical protein ACI4A3_04240 [Lachnospiraceae bacterium]
MKKYFITGILTLAIVITMVLSGTPTTVSAASWKMAYNTNGVVTVAAGQSFEASLTTTTYGHIAWQTTLLNAKLGYTVILYDSKGIQVGDAIQVSADDSEWKSQKQTAGMVYYHMDQFQGIMAGTYYIHVKFDSDSDTQAMFNAQTKDDSANMPALQNTEENVTVGFTTTLCVKNDTIKNCTSSNTSVATVTSTGVVTGNKKGTAIITVTTTKDITLTCKVNVKANTYSAAKITKSDVKAKSYDIKAYSAKYDSKGKLVIKAMAINKGSSKVKVKFWIGAASSNANLSRTDKKMSLTLPAKRAKSVTIKVPKSSLIKKKTNLPVEGIKICYVRQ